MQAMLPCKPRAPGKVTKAGWDLLWRRAGGSWKWLAGWARLPGPGGLHQTTRTTTRATCGCGAAAKLGLLCHWGRLQAGRQAGPDGTLAPGPTVVAAQGSCRPHVSPPVSESTALPSPLSWPQSLGEMPESPARTARPRQEPRGAGKEVLLLHASRGLQPRPDPLRHSYSDAGQEEPPGESSLPSEATQGQRWPGLLLVSCGPYGVVFSFSAPPALPSKGTRIPPL